MSVASIPETIQFLKFIRRGYDPQAFVQSALEEKSREIDGQFRAMITSLISSQAAVEGQIEDLVPRVVALDIVQPGQNQCETSQKQLDELRDISRQLQETLAQTQMALKMRSQNVVQLNRGFQQLHNQLNKLSSPYEAPLLELGLKASNFFTSEQ
jgi:chromosome segregation ATPase